ncbi:hypothetical protein F7018_04925 [Tenacibaculum aiptasiae]|uniref:Uncharacterized protein n=1 Tax=Tenacibaculum aiptasiae TaxID=426481 RepID=A0A7J5APW0_9FLAO|nr:hypothetical protein [Tenacibaculum aiptasiae]KAB1159656.1 hypothetical protein F7018_04925 [Tenacibaculum aiptasiae]
MKKLEINKMENLQGGDIWETIAGGCSAYTGLVLFKVISNAHPVLKGLSYGCYVYLLSYGVANAS